MMLWASLPARSGTEGSQPGGWGSAEERGPRELRQPAAPAPRPGPSSALHCQPQHLRTQSEAGLGCGASLGAWCS